MLEFRAELGLGTAWNTALSEMLSQSLAGYENEKLTGHPPDNAEFQECLKRSIPKGHTFKGYPVQFLHRNAAKIFSACARDPLCADILEGRGDQVQHSLRVKVSCYPEGRCAVWLMLAVTYRSVL